MTVRRSLCGAPQHMNRTVRSLYTANQQCVSTHSSSQSRKFCMGYENPVLLRHTRLITIYMQITELIIKAFVNATKSAYRHCTAKYSQCRNDVVTNRALHAATGAIEHGYLCCLCMADHPFVSRCQIIASCDTATSRGPLTARCRCHWCLMLQAL